MPRLSPHALTLTQGQTLILERIVATGSQALPLTEAVGRVCAETIVVHHPLPHFRQAARDGFAVRDRDLGGGHETSLVIAGEVAAGCTTLPRLRPGTALRVMTGAPLPFAASRVLPSEECREGDDRLVVGPSLPARRWLRARGCELAKGRVIVRQGGRISLEHLAALAGDGVSEVLVHAPPPVAFFCTGSELITTGGQLRPGLTFSSNRYLLQALIGRAGGRPLDGGVVPDDRQAIAAAILRQQAVLHESGAAQGLLITTGGMGPGKYDLVAAAFRDLGGTVLYQGLKAKPGKATLFGSLGNLLLFGLPGPPPAVKLLFQTLVEPALQKAQGLTTARPLAVRAFLREPITTATPGVTHLKDGHLSMADGRLTVRVARRLETADAIIVLPAGRRRLPAGTKVRCYRI